MNAPTPHENHRAGESFEHAAPPEDAPSAQQIAETEAVLADLAGRTALLPQVPPAEGEPARPEGAVSLPVIEQDGTQYIPVFTAEETLVAAGGDPATALRISVAELAANWPADELWLAVDPSTEEGLALPPDLVRALPVFAGAAGDA
ncbi:MULTISPECIES: SseB family protein [unclassified Streptomyces]|uniref:SseB family protein n=1 Tax=unclassified Streptomyces TaxID=2593676 RepID=UPI0037F7F874